MSDIKSVNHPNKVTGRLRIDPNGLDTTQFGVYSTGTVQEYELGTRYRQDDRVFRYGRAGSALDPKLGAFEYGTYFGENTVAAAVVGQNYVVITTDATSGSVTNGFGVKNNMVGGYFSQPDGTHKQWRRITGHVAAPTGTTVKVYLDGPITAALPAGGAFSEWCPNPYRDLRANGGIAGGINKAVMGIPTVVIALGSYGWFQTWGPCWVAPDGILDFGAGGNQMAVFTVGGNITNHSNATNNQTAGFVFTARTFGNWANPPFLYLTISP